MSKKSLGNKLVQAMSEMVEDIKNDVPLRTTTYERQKDGSLKRTVGMKRPSELKKK